MPKRAFQWRYFIFGCVELAIALGIMFLLPNQAFLQSTRRNSELTYQGLATIFGEIGARYFFALPFLIFSIISFRKAASGKENNRAFYEDTTENRQQVGSPFAAGRLRGRISRVKKQKGKAK